MKKINSKHSNKDRVICVSTIGKHKWYYQPEHSCERIWLFDTDFSGSVFDYFRDYGRNMEDMGYSLTIGELYRFRKHWNVKLSKLMDRIPGQIDYVIKEGYAGGKDKGQACMRKKKKMCVVNHMDERVA